MAIQSTAQWWIRTDGDDDNGGGFDSAISGSGTNYSDQASAQLSLTDITTLIVGDTTIQSSTGGFTSAMVGNSIKIRSGTNVVPGYYFITGFTSSTAVTLDRAPDNGGGAINGASGKVGGAWTNIQRTLSTAAVSLGNTVASPLIGGHTVNVRGSGSDNPSTPDYTDFTNWRFFPTGSREKAIKFVGYNGKPSIQASSSSGSLIFYQVTNYVFEDMKFVANGSGNNIHGLINSGGNLFAVNCVFDMAGHDAKGGKGSAYQCHFYDSGSASSMTYTTWEADQYNAIIAYNFFDNLPVTGNNQGVIHTNNMATVIGNVIVLPSGAKGFYMNNGNNYKTNVVGNIFVGGAIAMDIYQMIGGAISNNIFSGCATAIKWTATGQINKPRSEMIIGNAFHNCTNNYDNISGTGDITLDASPFVDPTASPPDLNLNNALSGGATLRSTKYTIGG